MSDDITHRAAFENPGPIHYVEDLSFNRKVMCQVSYPKPFNADFTPYESLELWKRRGWDISRIYYDEVSKEFKLKNNVE